MSHSPLRLATYVVAFLSLVLGCDEPRPRVQALAERTVFVAMARDFRDFRSWGYVSLGQRPSQGATHTTGELRVFVNALPPMASKEFPVGTMIIKESLADHRSGQPKRHFAMVKRSATFNAQGAKG